MATFDIMKATAEGYKFLWHERAIVLRLAALPVLIKFICLTTVISFGFENNVLRQGLVMLPSYLIEGYLLCALIRIGIYRHESLIQPPGSGAFEYYKQRGRDIQAGAVIYALIKLFMMFIVGVAMSMTTIDPTVAEQPEPSPQSFLSAVIAFILMIWAFRLIWLNIPVTLGYDMKEYLKKIKGMSFSFHIFSVWVMCIIPFGLAIILFSDIFSAATMHTAENPSDVYRFLMLSVQSVVETMMNIVSSVAVAFGIFLVLTGQNFMPKQDKD